MCEDYAFHADHQHFSQAIISDGCSGSNRTDIGARLVSHAAILESTPLGTIMRARLAAISLNLENTTLDATLFKIERDNLGDIIEVTASGDGFIATKSSDKLITVHSISAPNGYPKYLSYLLDEDRNALYTLKNGWPWIKTTRLKLNDDGLWEIETEFRERGLPEDGVYQDEIPVYPNETIAVFSDGVDSFTDENGETVSALDIIAKMMSFKNHKGEFVKRKVKAVLRKLKAQGWSHHDDISMAAIRIEDL